MPLWAALLCATAVLKGVSALPTDSSPTTSAGGVAGSTDILKSRGSSIVALGFYDSCPMDSAKAQYKGGNVTNYTPKTCQVVDPVGDVMKINWKDAGINSLAFYADSQCKNLIQTLTPGESMGKVDSKYETESCEDLKEWAQVMSVQGNNPEESPVKRGTSHSSTSLSSRDTTPQPSNGRDANGNVHQPVTAVDFWDSCPLYNPTAKSMGGNVLDYVLNTCQEVNPTSHMMGINWKAGFKALKLFTDKKCKDEATILFQGLPKDIPAAMDHSCQKPTAFEPQSVQSFMSVDM